MAKFRTPHFSKEMQVILWALFVTMAYISETFGAPIIYLPLILKLQIIDPGECQQSITLRVQPKGTYLFVDTTTPPELGRSDEKNPPTSIYLSYLCVGPGDFIALQRVGAFKAGDGERPDGSLYQDDNPSMVAVFYGNGTALSPGPGTTASPIGTFPTYIRNISTDIPEDFWISSHLTLVQVPIGASAILFSPNDSFFSDNSDPNGDYSVILTPFR